MKISFTTTLWKNNEDLRVEVTAQVTKEVDPCGTGDSPTAYPVEILEVINDDGAELLDAMSPQDLAALEATAIDEFKSYPPRFQH